jgi:hypothetical protein
MTPEDQAAQIMYLDAGPVRLGNFVGQGEQYEWDMSAGYPMRLDRSKFGWLILKSVLPVLVTNYYL